MSLVPILNISLRFIQVSLYKLSSGRCLPKFFPLESQNVPLSEKKVPVAIIIQALVREEPETFMSDLFISTETKRRVLCEDEEQRENRGYLKMEVVTEMML